VIKKLIFDSEIGTAKDNLKSPLHDWYRFTAGFSHKLVEEIIVNEKLRRGDQIFESFAGCGTTLVTAQKNGIGAVGNEGQELLYDVIRAKLNWNIDPDFILDQLQNIKEFIRINNKRKRFDVHELLLTLYRTQDLKQIVLIRDYLNNCGLDEKHYLFLKLALTQTLHKVSIHPIAIPYIVRNKTLALTDPAIQIFTNLVLKMLSDLKEFNQFPTTSKIYLHDSRQKNENIPDLSSSVCITSPPYLNNLDYGEVSKVCSHFFGITATWNDITEKVRKNLVTGSTTHYKETEFDINAWEKREFFQNNQRIGKQILSKAKQISKVSNGRGGKKSYDILALYYFEDMYKVLNEMNRVLNKKKKAYLVLGDSAPYGVYINTTKILGEIALSCGFKNYNIVNLRERGTKWKTLTHRHSLKLSESVLILKKS
jgi:DNA modification methylase